MTIVQRFPRSSALFVLALLTGSLPGVTSAQEPTISGTSPQAVKPGAVVDVTVRGGNLAGATQLWTSFPATAVLAPGVKDNGKNAAQVVFRVAVPKTAAVGIHGIRVVTPNGVSALHYFMIDDLPSVAQTANTAVSNAQPITLPVAIDGVVNSLGRHYFKFTGKAGEAVSLEAVARRIGSPLDPIVKLFAASPNGPVELGYSDDAAGMYGDSQFSQRLPHNGEYLVEIRDIAFQGGGNHRFRLRIGDFPCVNVPYPMGAKRGSVTTLTFGGSDVENIEPIKVNVPNDPNQKWIAVGAKRKGGKSSGFATLAVTASDEALEAEPNDDVKQATRVALGANLNGRFEKPGDRDRFVFAAKKGQKFTFNAITRSQGSPADVYLQLQNATGAKLAETDDAGMTDGSISYTFPADGDYQVVVEDLNQRGGSEFVYRVVVDDTTPAFDLSATADRLNIPKSGTATITVTATRRGYNGPIQVSATGLPQGVVSVPTVIGPGRNSVNLTLIGSENIKAGVATKVQIVGTGTVGGKTVSDIADVNEALKAIAGGYPFPTRLLSNTLTASAAPTAPYAIQLEPQTVNVPKGKTAKLKVRIARSKDITEAITLALVPVPKGDPKKAGLPPGLTVAVKPLAKGQTEVELVITATAKSPTGSFTANLTASHKKGKATVVQHVPGILINVQ